METVFIYASTDAPLIATVGRQERDPWNPPPPAARRPAARPAAHRLLRLRRRRLVVLRLVGLRRRAPGCGSRWPSRPTEHFSPYGAGRHLPQPARRHRGADRAWTPTAPRPPRSPSPGAAQGRPQLAVHAARGHVPGRHRRHRRAAVAAALTHAARAEPGARRPHRRRAHREGRGRRTGARHHRPARPRAAAAAVQPRPRRALPEGVRRRSGAVDPVGTATGPFELTKTTGDHRGHPRPLRRLLGRPRPGLRHRRPVHRRRHRPRQRPAHRPGRHRRGDPRRAGRLPRQGHPSARRPPPATTSLHLNTRSGAFTDPKLRAAAREAVDTSAVAERRVRRPRRAGQGHLRPRADLGGGQARPAHRPGRRPPTPDGNPSPSPPTTTGPNCPRSPRCCNSSWRRPGSR